MHLVACATPQEPLEDAPRTALLADLTEGERWEGFWSSDAYFVRCTRAAGEVEWFRLADDDDKQDRKKRSEKDATRVLVFPMRGPGGASGIIGATAKPRRQTRVLVAKGPDGRRMLVGTANRAPRHAE
jgi:hypothetical protein